MPLLEAPHHDGGPLHLAGAPRLGGTVTVRLRVPHGARAERVHVRTTPDAEPAYTAAEVERETPGATWWRAEVAVGNPVVRYRFLLSGGGDERWVNGAGTFDHDVDDAHDFVLSTFPPPPGWLADTVVYQVFPDRFASSGASRPLPEWAVGAAWDEPVSPDWRRSVRQVFGGDLAGLTGRLDHLERLGVNAVYLTPVFPAHSAHRYDATTFDEVDPLLGGDEALAALTASAHARGIRVIGDLTTNHTGAHHSWFRAAQAHRDAPEAGFYLFHAHPDDYEAWFGVRSLPKLDHRSAELRSRMVTGPQSVVSRWLRPPFELDGWRIDVANMTARLHDTDLNAEVARDIRATMAAVRPDGWLVAEHCYDAGPDLVGDGWHGTMAYSWFTRPAWCWLRGDDPPAQLGYPNLPPRLPAHRVVAGMRAMAARVPWRSFTASMTLLDSHDTARFADVVPSRAHHVVGLALLLAYPGVPMIFAGDEVGMRGRDENLARSPFPWDEARWDHDLVAAATALVHLRRRSTALRRGGLRWVHAGDDSMTFLREDPEERVLVHLARAPHEPVSLPIGALELSGAPETLFGTHRPTVEGEHLVLPGDGPAATICRIGP